MTFSTLEQVLEILGADNTDDDYFAKVRGRQAEIYELMIRELKRCDPNRIPVPFELLTKTTIVSSMTIPIQMPAGRRRILFYVSGGSTFASGSLFTLKGTINNADVAEDTEITGNGFFLTDEVFEELDLTAGGLTASAELVAAGASVQVFEHVGAIADIEARWVAGLFEDEESKHRSREAEPPVEHVWITEAKERWGKYLRDYCVQEIKGQQISITVSRGYP